MTDRRTLTTQSMFPGLVGHRFNVFSRKGYKVGEVVDICTTFGLKVAAARVIQNHGQSGAFMKFDSLNKVTVNGGEDWYEFEIIKEGE